MCFVKKISNTFFSLFPFLIFNKISCFFSFTFSAWKIAKFKKRKKCVIISSNYFYFIKRSKRDKILFSKNYFIINFSLFDLWNVILSFEFYYSFDLIDENNIDYSINIQLCHILKEYQHWNENRVVLMFMNCLSFLFLSVSLESLIVDFQEIGDCSQFDWKWKWWYFDGNHQIIKNSRNFHHYLTRFGIQLNMMKIVQMKLNQVKSFKSHWNDMKIPLSS